MSRSVQRIDSFELNSGIMNGTSKKLASCFELNSGIESNFERTSSNC
jgi:hypothetical protein